MNCECGHPIEKHLYDGCSVVTSTHGEMKLLCICSLDKQTAEARAWAIKMMKERDALQRKVDILRAQINMKKVIQEENRWVK